MQSCKVRNVSRGLVSKQGMLGCQARCRSCTEPIREAAEGGTSDSPFCRRCPCTAKGHIYWGRKQNGTVRTVKSWRPTRSTT